MLVVYISRLLLTVYMLCINLYEYIYTHKSAGVVVTDRLGIAEGLQQRVGLQDDVFNMLHTHIHVHTHSSAGAAVTMATAVITIPVDIRARTHAAFFVPLNSLFLTWMHGRRAQK